MRERRNTVTIIVDYMGECIANK